MVWRYEIALRKREYYLNCGKTPIDSLMLKFWQWRHFSIGVKCGFTIPCNTFGKGLSIAHIGNIIVNSNTRIGDNCRIHVGVNIGTAAGTSKTAPQIGNNVYIGPGAKLFGNIKIADGIAIGANAVVTKDCLENNVTLLGVPAKISSNKGSKGFMANYQ